MASYVNSLKSMIQRDPKWSVKGPVLQSQRFVERFQQDMIVLECECMHGAKVDAGFGYFVEVANERNTNKSRLKVYFPADLQALSAAVVGDSADSAANGTYYRSGTDGSGNPTYHALSTRDRFEIKLDTVWKIYKNGAVIETSSGSTASPWAATWPTSTVTESASEPTPVFRTRTQTVTNPNQYMCKAQVARTFVPIGADAESGTNIWENEVNPYDEWHDERVTFTVLTLNTVTVSTWDELLRQFIQSEVVLTQTLGSNSTVVSGGTVTHIWYEEVRCGWFLKHTDTFSSSLSTFWTSETFYWPPVATQVAVPFFQVINGRYYVDPEKAEPCNTSGSCEDRTQKRTYPVKYLTSIDVKEAYNDACKVKVEEVFKTSIAEDDIVNQVMLPEAIHYDGIIQDFKLAPTLHTNFINMAESVGVHPTLEPAFRVASFPATNETEWPDTITRTFVRPYRGGYVVTTKTYHKPE